MKPAAVQQVGREGKRDGCKFGTISDIFDVDVNIV